MDVLFEQEMDKLVKQGLCSVERKKKFEKWVKDAERARGSGSFNPSMNQYDKAEELLTWYTFAVLFRMTPEQQLQCVNDILRSLIGPEGIKTSPTCTLEKLLSPPQIYLDSVPTEHPVRYIREKIKKHRIDGLSLEGSTHIDFFIESEELMIPIEAKFTSDIDIQVTYNCIRNQIARTIDVTLEAACKEPPKKVVFLLCVPEHLYNSGRLYFYKMEEYQNIERLKEDLPHQADAIDAQFHSAHVIYWHQVASIIMTRARKEGLLAEWEIQELMRFYEERMIQVVLK